VRPALIADRDEVRAALGDESVTIVDSLPEAHFRGEMSLYERPGHIPGAVNIPRGLLEFEVDGHPAVAGRTAEELSHRDRPVVLYCLSGGRSALAAEALKRLGFVTPMSLAGGILGWEVAGLPVARPGSW